MNRIAKFRRELARVFDDNLRTNQWHNYVDYGIITLIIISTLQVFISTFDVSSSWIQALHWIDIITLIIFTVEVSLRIWVADLLNSKYRGFIGRIKYCLSFYGLIDFLSTYPFFLTFWIPIPYTFLKVLRIARLLRIFRYMKSFRLLTTAIISKKKEMAISLQFLVIITLILSFILFFFEHKAQPHIYDNGIASAIWAFAQYIGDPGHFAETPPITTGGRIIACIVGILGIAIFAVPAGLIGAGFTEAIENERKQNTITENTKKLRLAFERKMDRPTRYQIVPPYVSIADIQSRLGLKTDDIFDVIENCNEFRLINLASTIPIDEKPEDKLAVEHFPVNQPYGCCIDRKSAITIVSPSSMSDAVVYNFAYYIAKIGGFNFISREIGDKVPYKSYYLFDKKDSEPNLSKYLTDIERLSYQDGSWIITILASSGQNEPTLPTQVHFGCGGKKGDETYSGSDLLVHDIERYDALYQRLSTELESKYGLLSDHQRFHDSSNPKLYIRKLNNREHINAPILRIAWSVICWDSRRIDIAKTMAEIFAEQLTNRKANTESIELKRKDIGYDDYIE